MKNLSIREELNNEWQIRIWKIGIFFAIAMLAIEIFYGLLKNNTSLPDVDKSYFRVFILTPFLINLFMVTITHFVIVSKKIQSTHKCWLVSLILFFMAASASYIHFIFYPMLLLPTVAIMITSVFGNKKITFLITSLSVISILMSSVRFSCSGSVGNVYFTGYTILSILFAISVGILTESMNSNTNRLVSAISSGYNKQLTLMSELKVEPLTGLYNRRAFEETMESKLRLIDETAETAFIAIFDIDHFKQVNDTYGHGNGDLVLKELSKLLKEKTKEQGLAFRYGGEEFVIIFNNLQNEKVIEIIEDIRTAFRCSFFQFMRKDGITVSCGLAEYKKGESGEAWFNRADKALYKAKDSGRNKTIISE